jgi:hypothetical protein
MPKIDMDALDELHKKAIGLPWRAGERGEWIYTDRAMLRTNRDGTLTKHDYNGYPICISRGSGGARRDRLNNAFIIAWCNAYEEVTAELRDLRARVK